MTQPTMEEIAGWLREGGLCEESLCWTTEDVFETRKTWATRIAWVEAMGWRPIEEAPKDGTKVDLWDEKAKERIPDCVWKEGKWQFLAFSTYWFALEREVNYFRLSPQPPVKK